MCIEVPESTTIALSSIFVEDGAGNDQTSASEECVALFFSGACGHLWPFLTHLCGRIAGVPRFIPEICPQILEHKG